MGFIDGLNRLIGIYVSSLKQLLKPKIWTPFFIYFIIQCLLLLLLKNYVNPYIYPILNPVIEIFGIGKAELFSHYPGLYLLLPYLFQWFKLAFGVLFEGLVIGITVILFVRVYSPAKYGQWKLSDVISRWHHLFICWAIISAILFAINWYIPQVFEEQLYGSPRRQMIFSIVIQLLTVGVYSLFIYAIPVIIMFKRNFLSAISTGFKYFSKYPIFTFFIAFMAYLLTVPTSFITGKNDVVVAKFSPELVFYVLFTGLVVDLFVNVVLTGAVVKFLDEESN